MANPTLTYNELKQQISSGKLAPVYLLHGKEGYFTDQLVKMFENVLPESEREFNQYVLYGPQIEPGRVMDLCCGFPMMGERQVVILKEAQAMRAEQINRLHRYVLDPSPTTVLVIVFRGDDAKGKDLLAACRKRAVIFESKEIKEYQMGAQVNNYVALKGMTIQSKATAMLVEFIGTNLSHMVNEIDKLATILGPHAEITPEAIERNIGISKEYNTWELIDALAQKNMAKCMHIANYFASNPKSPAYPQITAAIYNYYADILIAFYAKDKSPSGLMGLFNLKNVKQLDRFTISMRNYNAFQIIECIWALRQFDVQSKGVGSRQNAHNLFRDLIFHLLTAPGNLGVK